MPRRVTPVASVIAFTAVAICAIVVAEVKLSCSAPALPATSMVTMLLAVAPVYATLPCVAALATWTTTLTVLASGRRAALICSELNALVVTPLAE